MRLSKIALLTTTGVLIAGSAGLAWLSNHRANEPPRSTEALSLPPAHYSSKVGVLPPSELAPRGLANASADASQNSMIASQKLIRTGQLSLEVKLFDEAFARLQRIATENGGYIADIKANRQDQGRASGTVVVRVQPDRYFQALDALRAIGKVEQEAVNTQDVTREYADLEARLTYKRQLEARMREILRTRASKMEELLVAEQQLSQVTEQIEQMEGQRRYFQQMVSMSAITLELHEPLLLTKALEPKKPGLFAPVAAAAKQSVELLVKLLALVVSALVFLAPWLVLGTGGWLLIRRRVARWMSPPSSEGTGVPPVPMSPSA